MVAGAGTGKTQVITRRIAWLIATRRAKPSEILALTFTDKAADEMQVRVDQLVPYGYADTAISTFHAFGDRLIREFALELGLPPDVRVLSRPEAVVFLRERLFELGLDEYRPLGDPTRFLGALATLFVAGEDEDVSPDALPRPRGRGWRAQASTASRTPRTRIATPRPRSPRTRAGRRSWPAPSGATRRCCAAQRGDRLRRPGLARPAAAARLARGPEAVQRRYRYILVDEFQDTNRAQAELVALLAERHRNVTVVGDDDQSIYSFRGAAISNILEFRERYRRARVVVLRRNYRSRAPILDASYRLIRFNDPDRLEVRAGISKRLVAERVGDDAAPVRHVAFASGAEEADWVAGDIARRIGEGARPRDHAVLVRANAEADPILRPLTRGDPVAVLGHVGPLCPARGPAALWRSCGPSPTWARPWMSTRSPRRTSTGSRRRTWPRSWPPRAAATAAVWEVLEELERQPGLLRLSPGPAPRRAPRRRPRR